MKKVNNTIISWFCSIVFLILLFAVPMRASAVQHNSMLGDTDSDSSITVTDCTWIQRDSAQLISLSETSKAAADVDSDGFVTIYDATCIQRWLVNMRVSYPIGQLFEQTHTTDSPKAVISTDEKTATIGNVSFNVSKLPDTVSITDSNRDKGITLMIVPKTNVDPSDMITVVNNGQYYYSIDYSDRRFKESYLMEKDSKILSGYDCMVSDDDGTDLAYVYAHYKGGLYYPYQTSIYCFNQANGSFPIDFYYKDTLIKRVMVEVGVSSGPADIESTRATVREIESKCWKDTMSAKEKMEAFSKYVSSNYTYSQVMCVDGAVLTAFAARDLGLSSMLLYPGGEPNQNCDRHLITYNLYQGTAVPGGHCACVVVFEDALVRYDAQGGLSWIRDYQFPY